MADQDRFVRLQDGNMHIVEDGKSDAPALLLIHGTAASTAYWAPVIPALAGAFRVLRIDLLGCGKSTSPTGGHDIPTQALRVFAALDRLGVSRVTVIGHSSGCMVATAMAEHRPDAVTALVLIDMGPSLDAKTPESRLARVLLTPFPGGLLWRMRTKDAIRKGARTSGGFTRPVEIPDAFIEDLLTTTHRDFVASARASTKYLQQQSLPDRLAPLGVPLLVVFGAEDRRYRSSSAAEYRAVPGARVELLPGVGHTPMMEDPEATSELLLEFAAAVARFGG